MSIKKVKVSSEMFGIDWDFNLEFDLSKELVFNDKPSTVEAQLKESLDFFSKGKDILKEYGGDLCLAYGRLIALTVMEDSKNHTREGIISLFNDYEGYLPLDGSYGVKLTWVETFELEDDFTSEYLS